MIHLPHTKQEIILRGEWCMEAQDKSSKGRVLWIAVLLAVLAVSAGGYFWYEQMAVKYDRITNAKRV
jgi:hypothetical protein